MIQRKYIGSLDAELMEEYSKLVEQGVSHKNGASHNIIFSDNGTHAIKYSEYNNLLYKPFLKGKCLSLEKEYHIGMDLAANNFHVPQMYAFSPGKENKKSFLVMEKLNLISMGWSGMGWFKRQKAKKQFNKQMRKANNLGYFPSEISIPLDLNCGWNKKHKCFYFYDFKYWDGPRVDEIMAEKE